MDLREIAKEVEKELRCNCDLDNWQPERSTGHSWVCRIHQTAEAIKRHPSDIHKESPFFNLAQQQ